MVKGNCRHCGAVIAFPGESAGELADCPSCGKAVMLTPPVEQAEVMPCPRCRESMSEVDSVCVECGFRMPRRIPWVRLGAVGLIVLMGLYMWVRLEGMDPRVLNELRAALGMIQDYKDWVDPGETWDFRALVLGPDATKYEMVKPIGGER